MALAKLNGADPRTLRVGRSIKTPAPELLAKRYPELFRTEFDRPRPSEQPQVGPVSSCLATIVQCIGTSRNDTLSSIAQNHLGRSSRWKQIYQLNRHLLSNPNEVQPNLVLALPDDASQVLMMR